MRRSQSIRQLVGLVAALIALAAGAALLASAAAEEPRNVSPRSVREEPAIKTPPRRPEPVQPSPQQQQAPEKVSRPRGAAVYVDDAVVDQVSPSALTPGEPFMVTVLVKLATPIPQSELIPALRVYVDAVEAPPVASAPAEANAAAGASAYESGPAVEPATRDDVGVTLRVVAPVELGASRDLTVSVYSTLDSRVIASAKVASAAARGEGLGISPEDPTIWIAGISTAVAAAATLLILLQRRMSRQQIQKLESTVQVERRRVSELGRAGAAHGSETPGAHGSAPELPGEVFASLQRGELALVLGPGASAQAGLPTSRSLWLNVLDRCGDRIPESQREGLRAMVANEGAEPAIEPIVSLAGRDAVLAALGGELMASGARPSPFHELLAELPVPAVLDMNWDDLMARALTGRGVQAFGPARQEGISEALRAGQVTLLKPFGDLRLAESVVLTEREYRRILAQAPELERTIAALFSTRTLLFFGFSLRGLEQFLDRLPPQLESAGRSHFGVVPEGSGLDLWEAGLGRRYGVTLVPYRPGPDFAELVVAAEALAAAVPGASEQSGATGGNLSLNSSRLTHLSLRSIGIFRELEVSFTPGWTLLLGNNGGGKSTILRAIAVALAGNDPRATPAARRLLRTGADAGSIELGMGTAKIVTQLVRDNQNVLVKSPQTTALQAGQILVLAFPALRGVATAQVRGPTNLAAAEPSVDDVAPLLEGAVDARLDNLKQWVVNTALRAEKDPNGRAARMFQTFQRLIAEMVPGGGLEFSRVDRQSWQVILKAKDAEVPFDGVSQGMSSILNWIGVLLERLYDVYPRSDEPEREPAIVLVDEIDAHLHPRWQRQLVALTRRNFPNVQIIASSHSPLLAGAVEHAELRVVAPNEQTGEIEARMPPEDVSGQKAEDILVSSVFSLETTRSVEAEATIQRYFELYQKGPLTNEEEGELESLSKRVRSLNYGPTAVEQRHMDRARSRVEHALENVSPEAAHAVKERLAAAPSREERAGSGPEEAQT